MMVDMSQLSGALMTPCGWVGPVVGGENLNGISQHIVSCEPCKNQILAFAVMLHISQEKCYKLCCDRFNMFRENPSEEIMCVNPI